jgi:hypothetical protein
MRKAQLVLLLCVHAAVGGNFERAVTLTFDREKTGSTPGDGWLLQISSNPGLPEPVARPLSQLENSELAELMHKYG